MCYSAANSNLHRCASETCDARNRADPVFDAWFLVLTSQSKSRWESYPGLKSKHQKFLISTRTTIFKFIQIQAVLPFLWAFSSPSNIVTAAPVAKNMKCLSSTEDSLEKAILTTYPPRLAKFALLWKSAHGTAVCVCFATCICRSACADG